MALSDWVQNVNGIFSVAIDISAPIVDSGSLSMDLTADAAAGINMYLDTPFSKGFEQGRIRSIIRYDTFAGGVGVIWVSAGLICMQSQLDVSGTSGACYVLGLGRNNTIAAAHLMLLKYASGGLSGTTVTALYDAVLPGSPVAGDRWTVELEWNADVASLGGTRLIARVGTKNSDDFGTLADVYDAVDTSSPLTTTVAEGIYGAMSDTSPATTAAWTFDETTIYELT